MSSLSSTGKKKNEPYWKTIRNKQASRSPIPISKWKTRYIQIFVDDDGTEYVYIGKMLWISDPRITGLVIPVKNKWGQYPIRNLSGAPHEDEFVWKEKYKRIISDYFLDYGPTASMLKKVELDRIGEVKSEMESVIKLTDKNDLHLIGQLKKEIETYAYELSEQIFLDKEGNSHRLWTKQYVNGRVCVTGEKAQSVKTKDKRRYILRNKKPYYLVGF